MKLVVSSLLFVASMVLTPSHATTSEKGGFVGELLGVVNSETRILGPGIVSLLGDLTIPDGVTLHISPGTIINGGHQITSSGGSVSCKGSINDPVVFDDVSFSLHGGSHEFEFCQLAVKNGIALTLNNVEANFEHLLISEYRGVGVQIQGLDSKVSMDFSTIINAQLRPNSVSIYVDELSPEPNITISNSVLGTGNNIGLLSEEDKNSIKVSYTNLGAGWGPFPNAIIGDGVTWGAPILADLNAGDFRLGNFSPLVDAASPDASYTSEPSPNGGRANLGYYGKTNQAQVSTIQVISPNGCEVFEQASELPVIWRANNGVGPVDILLSTDGGGAWQTLAREAENTGFHAVHIPEKLRSQSSLIKVVSSAHPGSNYDQSDNSFGIGAQTKSDICSAKPRCDSSSSECKSFKAIAYSGYRDNQSPTGSADSEPGYEQVYEDLSILSKYTKGIRTYGSELTLHGGKYVPEISYELGLELHMGIWLDHSYSDAINMHRLEQALEVLSTDKHSIKSIVVGNEYIYRATSSGISQQDAENQLIKYIKYIKEQVPPGIQVTSGEVLYNWLEGSKEFFEAVDFVLWHVHPFWEGIKVNNSVEHLENVHQKLKNKLAQFDLDKREVLGETGFPWGGCFRETTKLCGTENEQTKYLSVLHTYAMKSGLEYWFFSAFDENWKGHDEGSVGNKWGMWKSDRSPHDIIRHVENIVPVENGWN